MSVENNKPVAQITPMNNGKIKPTVKSTKTNSLKDKKVAKSTTVKTTISKTTTKRPSTKPSAARKKEIKLNDEQVSQYLIQNPDFFIRQAQQIERMRVPHPVRGVVSLTEWQLSRQRNMIKQLEHEITLLMEHASLNESLFESLMATINELVAARDLNDLVLRLNKWAKSLGLYGAYLYLFANKWQLGSPSCYRHMILDADRFEFIRIRHLQFSYHYLGRLNPTEMDIIVPEPGCVGSVALSLLGQFGDLGLLVFASRNPNHYHAEQGTLLLEKIGAILPILIERWVARQ